MSGETVENTIDELAITGLRVDSAYEDSFRVEATVENTGEKQVDLTDHEFGLVTYDADGTDISTDGLGYLEAESPAPGETGTLIRTMSYGNSRSSGQDVARYEVTLTCGPFNDGGYCAGQGTEAPTATEQPSEGSDLPTYEFTEGESYTYDTLFLDAESEQTWEVTTVDGDDLTVERESVIDGETETQTFTGTHGDISDAVAEGRDFNLFPLLRGTILYGEEGDLTAGNTFTVQTPGDSTDWDSETVEVNGEKTVNGVTGTEITVTPDSDSTQVSTVCLADGYPFALSMLMEQNGEPLIEATLIDSTRP